MEPVSDKEHVVGDNKEVLGSTQGQLEKSSDKEKSLSEYDFDLDFDDFDDEGTEEVEEIEDGTWGTIWHKKSTDQYYNEDGDELVKEDGEFVEKI